MNEKYNSIRRFGTPLFNIYKHYIPSAVNDSDHLTNYRFEYVNELTEEILQELYDKMTKKPQVILTHYKANKMLLNQLASEDIHANTRIEKTHSF